MENNIFNLWTYFIIYSIAGWILESVYRSICEKKLINTGFLNGPFCPIYGIGAIIMFMFLEEFQNNPIAIFIISFVVLSTWEYIVGICLERIFKTKYWDYSDHKINLNGRICLTNSICWGILGVLFIKYIHPYVERNLQLIDLNILRIIIYIITIIFIIDAIVSIVKTKNIKNTLNKIEDLNNQIKERLEEVKKFKNKKSKVDITESLQNTLDKLTKKKNRILRNLYRRVYRLKKAFPDIETKEITDILNKKIEIIKKEKGSKKGEK